MVTLRDKPFADAVQIAEEVAEAAYDCLSNCSANSDELSQTRTMLLCTVADGLHAVVALLKSHGQAHVNTILRSMMEALGDLDHLNGPRAAEYYDRLRLTSALNRKQEGTKLIQSRVGDASSAAVVETARVDCRAAKKVIDELQKVRKLAHLTINERVQGPSLGPDVIGIYGQFCFDAHNDVTALRQRHFRDGELVLGDTLDVTAGVQAAAHAVLITTLALAYLNDYAKSVDIRYLQVMNRALWATQTLHGAHNALVHRKLREHGLSVPGGSA